MLTNDEKPRPGVSRIHGTRQILSELRRLKGKADRAVVFRALPLEQRAWLTQVGDALDRLIATGEKLPLPIDRRRRVRKSRLF